MALGQFFFEARCVSSAPLAAAAIERDQWAASRAGAFLMGHTHNQIIGTAHSTAASRQRSLIRSPLVEAQKFGQFGFSEQRAGELRTRCAPKSDLLLLLYYRKKMRDCGRYLIVEKPIKSMGGLFPRYLGIQSTKKLGIRE